MNEFAKRTPPPPGEELPDLEVPGFLRQTDAQQGVEADIARLPHPARSDPLHEGADEVLQQSILRPADAYVESILAPLRQDLEFAQETLRMADAWADGERGRARARAEDVIESRRRMRGARERFLSLPGAEPAAGAAQETPESG